jgi:dihydrofolate reductase
MKDAIEQTGAVLMGRKTFEMGDADSYVGNYEFQVPIFVLTHRPPSVAPKQDEHLTFTFVTGGVESAVSQAELPPAIKQFRWSAASAEPNSSRVRDSSTSFMLISCRYS